MAKAKSAAKAKSKARPKKAPQVETSVEVIAPAVEGAPATQAKVLFKVGGVTVQVMGKVLNGEANGEGE